MRLMMVALGQMPIKLMHIRYCEAAHGTSALKVVDLPFAAALPSTTATTLSVFGYVVLLGLSIAIEKFWSLGVEKLTEQGFQRSLQ